MAPLGSDPYFQKLIFYHLLLKSKSNVQAGIEIELVADTYTIDKKRPMGGGEVLYINFYIHYR